MTLDDLLDGGRVLPITRGGTPVMHTRTLPVTSFDAELLTLVRDMFATMKASDGVGLAATQVGIGLSLFIYDCPDGEGVYRRGAVCNPSLVLPVGEDRRIDVASEGCLSLPGAFQAVARPDRAACTGTDPFGNPVTVRGTGVLARCLQHETDHLSGVVFGDRLPTRSRRDLYKRADSAAGRFPEHWPATSNTGVPS